MRVSVLKLLRRHILNPFKLQQTTHENMTLQIYNFLFLQMAGDLIMSNKILTTLATRILTGL